MSDISIKFMLTIDTLKFGLLMINILDQFYAQNKTFYFILLMSGIFEHFYAQNSHTIAISDF